MAKKKSRNVPRSSAPRLYSGSVPPPAGTAPVATTTGQPQAAPAAKPRGSKMDARTLASARAATMGLTQDYSYVIRDLRRLGLVAAAFIAGLVALGVIFRFVQ